MGRQSIKQQLDSMCRSRQGYGRSKHLDKTADKQYLKECGENFDKTKLNEKYYFHTKSTYENCLNSATKFVRWANKTAGRPLNVNSNEIKELIGPFINEKIKMAQNGEITPRTVARIRSELSKTFLVDTDYIKILPCTAESLKGRGIDPHWNWSNHKAAHDFYAACGCRKNEYRNLSNSEVRVYSKKASTILEKYDLTLERDIHGRCSNILPVRNEQGLVEKIVVVKAKHGKTNVSEIIPRNMELVTRVFDEGQYQNFFNPSDHCNIHSCRREYAQELYKEFTRDIDSLDENDLYRCRDGSMRVYDRAAVSRIATSLGHAKNDLFDTIHNYLR